MDLGREAVTEGDGFAHEVGREVVDEDDIGLVGQHFGELLEGVDFDFEQGFGRQLLLCEIFTRFFDGLSGRVADLSRFAPDDEMVVLDEDRRMQAESVIHAAALLDGVFFEAAVTGRGFTGVVDTGFRVLHGVDEAAGECGDPGEFSEQIEDRSLSDEEVLGVALENANNASMDYWVAVLHFMIELHPEVHRLEYEVDRGNAGEDAGGPGADLGFGAGLRRHERDRGDIKCAIEILPNRHLNEQGCVVDRFDVPGGLGEFAGQRDCSRLAGGDNREPTFIAKLSRSGDGSFVAQIYRSFVCMSETPPKEKSKAVMRFSLIRVFGFVVLGIATLVVAFWLYLQLTLVSESQTSQIHAGMSKEEVRQLLGNPHSERARGKTWEYYENNGNLWTDPFVIQFDAEDRVKEEPHY